MSADRIAENLSISRQNTLLFDQLPDISQISLKRIVINHNTSQHDEIDPNKYYLGLIGDVWRVGKFSRQWYGWNFYYGNGAGYQLNFISILYETDLTFTEIDLIPYIKDEDYD